jgi:hypothetical protein
MIKPQGSRLPSDIGKQGVQTHGENMKKSPYLRQ